MRRESLKLLPTAPGPISPQPTPLFASSLVPTPCTGGGVGSQARLPLGHTQGPGAGTGPPRRGGRTDRQTAGRPPQRAGRQEEAEAEAGVRRGGLGLGVSSQLSGEKLPAAGGKTQTVFSSRGPRSPAPRSGGQHRRRHRRLHLYHLLFLYHLGPRCPRPALCPSYCS